MHSDCTSNPGKRGNTGKHGNHRRGPRVEHVPITCEYCGTVRMYTPSEVRVRKVIRFCSQECAKKSRQILSPMTCPICGEDFQPRRSTTKYCSRACSVDAQRIDNPKWEDPEYRKEYLLRYRMNHYPRLRAMQRKWNAGTGYKADVQRRRREAEKAGTFTLDDWHRMLDLYDHKCLCCGATDRTLTLDHIVPLLKGGAHEWENIQPLCALCNSKKSVEVIDYRP